MSPWNKPRQEYHLSGPKLLKFCRPGLCPLDPCVVRLNQPPSLRFRDGNVPPANDFSVFSANGNIISNYYELDVVGLLGKVGCVLLFGETEVEDISCIVSCGTLMI